MLLVNIGTHRISLLESVQITLASFVSNLIFIATVSGIFVRVVMACNYGASLFKAIFATGVDRMMTLMALLILTALFLPALGSYFEAPLVKSLSIFVAVLLLMLFTVVPLFTNILIKIIPRLPFSEQNKTSGTRYLTLLFHSKKLIFKIIAISLAAQLSFFIANYCIISASGTHLTFLQIMTVLPAIALVSSLPIGFGGWGVREGAFIYGLGILGVGMEPAFAISVQIGLLSIFVTLIMGLPAFFATKNTHLNVKLQENNK